MTKPLDGGEQQEGVTYTPEQQAFFDKRVQQRVLAEGVRMRAVVVGEQKAATDKAESDRLAAAGEYKQLLATTKARNVELEPLVAEVQAYRERDEKELKTKVKTLNEAGKKIVAALGDGASTLAKLAIVSAMGVEMFVEVPKDGQPKGRRVVGRPARRQKAATTVTTTPVEESVLGRGRKFQA